MRLQEVLKEREAEITALETSLKEKDNAPLTPGQPSPDSPSTPINGEPSPSAFFSPKTKSQFQELQRSLDHTVSDPDESLERLNELMR